MANYQKTFELGVTDVSLIEESLTKQASQLSLALQEASDDASSLYKAQLSAVRDLLGRIHNQKIWFQPRNYVPQG